MKKEPKKDRVKIPQITKVRSELQKEINSVCPFCENEDVGHFQIHHIDENPSNNSKMNLILLCANCHSKITKGDISREQVLQKKIEMLSNSKEKSIKINANKFDDYNSHDKMIFIKLEKIMEIDQLLNRVYYLMDESIWFSSKLVGFEDIFKFLRKEKNRFLNRDIADKALEMCDNLESFTLEIVSKPNDLIGIKAGKNEYKFKLPEYDPRRSKSYKEYEKMIKDYRNSLFEKGEKVLESIREFRFLIKTTLLI